MFDVISRVIVTVSGRVLQQMPFSFELKLTKFNWSLVFVNECKGIFFFFLFWGGVCQVGVLCSDFVFNYVILLGF